MPQSREIHIFLVCYGRGAGIQEIALPDAAVTYSGLEIIVGLSEAHKSAAMREVRVCT